MGQRTRRRGISAGVLLVIAAGLLSSIGQIARADHTARLTLQAVQDHVDDVSASIDALASPPLCGNGTLDPVEACDGSTTVTCQDLGFTAGTVSCLLSCGLDTSACVP